MVAHIRSYSHNFIGKAVSSIKSGAAHLHRALQSPRGFKLTHYRLARAQGPPKAGLFDNDEPGTPDIARIARRHAELYFIFVAVNQRQGVAPHPSVTRLGGVDLRER